MDMSHRFNTSLKDLEGEVWKVVEGYNGKYEISNKGRVKAHGKHLSKNKFDFIKPKNDGAGYYQVRLNKDCKSNAFRLHRLVAEYFLENVSIIITLSSTPSSVSVLFTFLV